jgi:hypothetical protein
MTENASTAAKVLEAARQLPEGTLLTAKELLHLGTRASVDQALSRLVRTGELLRPSRGVYVAPVTGKFGRRSPAPLSFVKSYAANRGERVAGSPASAANALGLTTQVPVQETYLTSGANREFKLGRQTVTLRHAPPWLLLFPEEPAGELARAIAWLGPYEVSAVLPKLRTAIPEAEVARLARARSLMPTWAAGSVSALLAHA